MTHNTSYVRQSLITIKVQSHYARLFFPSFKSNWAKSFETNYNQKKGSGQKDIEKQKEKVESGELEGTKEIRSSDCDLALHYKLTTYLVVDKKDGPTNSNPNPIASSYISFHQITLSALCFLFFVLNL